MVDNGPELITLQQMFSLYIAISKLMLTVTIDIVVIKARAQEVYAKLSQLL